jgi:hypothetical protein
MRIRSLIALGFLLAVSGASLTAEPFLFTIGPDNNFVPRSFTSISVDASSVTSLFNLGDGSLGFNGGLTFRPTDGLFYAIANDGSGNSTIQSFSLAGAGTLTSVLPSEAVSSAG